MISLSDAPNLNEKNSNKLGRQPFRREKILNLILDLIAFHSKHSLHTRMLQGILRISKNRISFVISQQLHSRERMQEYSPRVWM